eukprot:2377931-Amphidinium_carterae.2
MALPVNALCSVTVAPPRTSSQQGNRARMSAGSDVTIGCGKPWISQCTDTGTALSWTSSNSLLRFNNAGASSPVIAPPRTFSFCVTSTSTKCLLQDLLTLL